MTPEELIPANVLAAFNDTLGAEMTTTVVADSESKVRSDCAAYSLEEEYLRRLTRAVAMHDLYDLTGDVPAAVQKAYESAMEEIKEMAKASQQASLTSDYQPGPSMNHRHLDFEKHDQDGA